MWRSKCKVYLQFRNNIERLNIHISIEINQKALDVEK